MRAARAVGAATALRQGAGKGENGATRASRKQKCLRIKIISMGDQASGKSCLIKRYCEEKFVNKYIGTIGVDYGVKALKLADFEVKVNLWDLAGADEYFEVRNEFYKDAQGAVLVFDVSSKASFEALDQWVEESARYGGSNAVVVVAGNKTDLGKRAVSDSEARAWADRNGFPYFEVSAASGDSVREMFHTLFARVIDRVPNVPTELSMAARQLAGEITVKARKSR